MFDVDVAVVTYNASRWIDGFFEAFLKIENFALNRLHFFFEDNHSTDDTVQRLQEWSNRFGNVYVCASGENKGFGAGSNAAARRGNAPYILFINIDTEICPDALEKAVQEILNSDETIGAWEMRQFPYEHPKIYNPVTKETSWMSGACFILRRDIFARTGGFDEDIFMYGEDVDLSWRIRSLGYKLLYIPKCCVYHYSYADENEVKPTQYFGSLKSNILLRWRYGRWHEIAEGYKQLAKCYIHPVSLKNARKNILDIFKETWKTGFAFRKKYNKGANPLPKERRKVAKFLGWDYEIARTGAFYKNYPYDKKKMPLVSVIVRTCGRPEVLRECLKSIENQTYPNVEVCIAEDGAPVSEGYIYENFPDLHVKYQATGERKGRSFAGNLAMSMASGEYLNFLDDDDTFYCDHIETMVNAALEHPEFSALYAKAFEAKTVTESVSPYVYHTISLNAPNFQTYSKGNLLINNLFPIQTVFFKRKLFLELGGFSLKYDYLEDWDLWLKYAQKYDYFLVDKLTSVYKVPAKKAVAKERLQCLAQNENEIRSRYTKQGKHKELDLETPKNDCKLLYCFDEMHLDKRGNIKVVGWCLRKGCDCAKIKVYLFAEDKNGKRCYLKVDYHDRADVAEAYKSEKYLHSGFLTIASLSVHHIEKPKKIGLVAVYKNKVYCNKKREVLHRNTWSHKCRSFLYRALRKVKKILHVWTV